jgi:hypothetical protein
MASVPRVIQIEPGSEVERLLREAVDEHADLATNDARYRVVRVDVAASVDADMTDVTLADERDIWADYDPARAQAGLRHSAGALRGVDREQLLADLAEQRGQDSRGRPA